MREIVEKEVNPIKRVHSIDMINGPLFSKLVLFALPLALTGILQLLFNAADLVVIGQFSKTPNQSLAAVSSNGALINLFVNSAIGFSIGANVLLSQAIGESNRERAERGVHTAMLFSVFLGLFIAVIGASFARIFLTWMNCDPEVIDKATVYLRIYFLGAPANIIYNFGASILRAKGDTKRPLVYLIISGIINVGLNLFLVIVIDFDVAGVAIATTVSQLICAILVVITLLKEKNYCKLDIKKLRIERKEFLEIIKVGLFSALQSAFFSIANIIIQTSVNGFGYKVMDGNAIGYSLEAFIYTSMNSVSNAATTFSGQNYGAKKIKRVNTIVWECFVLEFIISTVMGIFMLVFGRFFAGFYSKEQQIIDYAIDRMSIIIPCYSLCGMVEVLVGAMRGLNHPISPVIPAILCVCIYRIIWVYTICKMVNTIQILYYSYPISWALNIVMDFVLYIFYYKKELKMVSLNNKENQRH